MLYKLSKTSTAFDAMELMPFKAFADYGLVEKDLENLLAENLLEVLFEGNQLMPILQERSRQAEADIYALDVNGDLVIFELKRSTAGDDAVHQALRYCETAHHWSYDALQTKLETYTKGRVTNLQTEHQSNFTLENPLPKSAFNQQQRLIIVGSAGSDGLVRNVEYWRSKGIAIEFIPYRIYEIGGEHYFEFFSPPYDSHSNPAHKKGVLFDTNWTYDEKSLNYMCENSRVAAFGIRKHIVGYLGMGDTIFLYHKGKGIVAAGQVRSGIKEDSAGDALYRDLEWLTPLPSQDAPKGMSAATIKEVLGHNFFWASTIKSPPLSVEESDVLLSALKDYLG